MSLKNWQTISPSEFQWEKEALDYLRQKLPTSSLYYAWSNFEFIAENGTIGEVDLLIITPYGFYLVEIKSRPGTIFGNNQTWTWRGEKSSFTTDNPLLLANKKAKKLSGLLKRQVGSAVRIPYLEPLVFCSHPDTQIELANEAGYRICLRDEAASNDADDERGIIAALMHRRFPGAALAPTSHITPSVVKTVVTAMQKIGIQSSQKNRRVGDYVLKEILNENPLGTFKDWLAVHNSVGNSYRQIRIYDAARDGADEGQASQLKRAALREYRILENLNHPNILQVENYTAHEFGPALIFKFQPSARRLDLFLSEQAENLNVGGRLAILRQIAEAVKYAHGKKIVHRMLCPQSVWINLEDSEPRVKVFNWQVGLSETANDSQTTGFGATMHPEYFVEDASEVYLSPENSTSRAGSAEHLDIFSLGAIAFHLLSGQPPADNRLDLLNKLRGGGGLQISSVIDGAGAKLQELIFKAANAEVSRRFETIDEFLSQLDEVEKEMLAPEEEKISNPLEAKKGDILEGDFVVESRLGSGSSAVAFLVKKNQQELVLKLANSSAHNERLCEEAEIVKKLDHPNVIRAFETVEIGGLNGYTMQKATGSSTRQTAGGDGKVYEGTLAFRLKMEGALHLEMLGRFGADLLEAVKYLETKGIYHRDIKPDNIGIRPLGKLNELHLVLFDFSLAKAPLDNIRAGTTNYLDWFLAERQPPRWDLSAERFAVAVTLYEMATGELPKWGDGLSNPEVLNCEVTIQSELFDVNLREKMLAFFEKALKRDYRQRFDNAVEMFWAWEDVFKDIEQPALGRQSSEDIADALENALLTTSVINLGLSTLAASVLDRVGVITVEELLKTPLRNLYRLRGVGKRTRQEIVELVEKLREKFPDAFGKTSHDFVTTDTENPFDASILSVDLLFEQINGVTTANKKKEAEILNSLFGLSGAAGAANGSGWKSLAQVADEMQTSLKETEQTFRKLKTRWLTDASMKNLRCDVVSFLQNNGGAMTVAELADALLAARGSSEVEPRRTQIARAVLRAVIETEKSDKKSQIVEKRRGDSIVFALNAEIAEYVGALSAAAETLAAQNPLPTTARVLETLREITPPESYEPLTDARLVKLSSALSDTAAVSSRAEIYPVGMSALEALKLAQGTLYGSRELTVEDIRRRIASRYPLAEKMPDLPQLKSLLGEIGLDLEWNAAANGGTGAFVYPELKPHGSGLSSSTQTVLPQESAAEISPEIADARLFENKLRRSQKEGAFLVLQVEPNRMLNAEREIAARFAVETINFDALLIEAMREQAEKLRVKWEVVLRADAARRDGAEWRNLMTLVGRSLPVVEEKICAALHTILLTCAGLLGRYDRLDLLDRLRNRIGYGDDGLKGLWLLLPTGGIGGMPKMDGKPVPVTSAAQWTAVPNSWLANDHRARKD